MYVLLFQFSGTYAMCNVQCNDGSHPKASRLVWDNVVGTIFKISLTYIITMFGVHEGVPDNREVLLYRRHM